MLQIGIVIYDDAEVMDFSGPYEVFSTAARLCDSDPWHVSLIAAQPQVTARGGFVVNRHMSYAQAPALDVLLVSGGVHSGQLGQPELQGWLRHQAVTAQWVSAVCTGAFLLADAGLLAGYRATTHWEDIADLRNGYPALSVEEKVRWVEDRNRLTSAGISAGIDMSLHLVEKLHSRKLAESTARQMDYTWQKPVNQPS